MRLGRDLPLIGALGMALLTVVLERLGAPTDVRASDVWGVGALIIAAIYATRRREA